MDGNNRGLLISSNEFKYIIYSEYFQANIIGHKIFFGEVTLHFQCPRDLAKTKNIFEKLFSLKYGSLKFVLFHHISRLKRQ